ncbi:MAG TPA: pectinesterase family protein, partial [Tepidisphaeraceae bacterium]
MNHPGLILSICLLMIASALAQNASTQPAKIRIVLAGDSTVTDKSGWGVGFKNYFGPNAEVINLSQGGRSSKSFIAEGHWAKCLEQKPDYILIQFGHNDQPGKGPERETDPQTTYRQNMTRYVDEARAAGAKPILVTSISRRKWKDDGHIHSDLFDYVNVVKQIAAKEQVPLIDLHSRSIEVYESLGKEGCELIEPVQADGKFDSTHFNSAGSELFGPIVADELRRALPELARYRKPYSPPTTRAIAATSPSESARAAVAAAMAPSSGNLTAKGARTITVPDDFKTIQEAIAAVADDNSDRTVIRIRPGTYFGQILLPATKANVTFEGENANDTILLYALNVMDPIPPTVPSS